MDEWEECRQMWAGDLVLWLAENRLRIVAGVFSFLVYSTGGLILAAV